MKGGNDLIVLLAGFGGRIHCGLLIKSSIAVVCGGLGIQDLFFMTVKMQIQRINTSVDTGTDDGSPILTPEDSETETPDLLIDDLLRHSGTGIDYLNHDRTTRRLNALIARFHDAVADIIETFTLVDKKDPMSLHIAASKDKSGELVSIVLNSNPDLEIQDADGLTPLFLAAFHGNLAVVRQLLDHGASPEAKEPDGFNALHYACMQAHHGFMARLLDPHGPDFEAFYDLSKYGFSGDPSRSPLCKEDRADTVRTLLAHGMGINSRGGRGGFTPLYIAAVTAQQPLIEILLAHGGAEAAGIPLITAYWGLTSEIVNELLSCGASISATDSRWNKPALTWEAEIGSPDNIQVLLRHGADVHHQDKQRSSALHYAAANARIESIKLLLDKGADPNATDMFDSTPLHRLALSGDFYLAGRSWKPSGAERGEAARLLLSAGCKADVRNLQGRMASHYAAENGYRGILEAIDAVGGDLEAMDEAGRTPWDIAREKGSTGITVFLASKFAIDKGEGEGGRASRR